jgi:hypothetical protein
VLVKYYDESVSAGMENAGFSSATGAGYSSFTYRAGSHYSFTALSSAFITILYWKVM